MTEASRLAIAYITASGPRLESAMASLADTRIPEDKRHILADILDELRLSRPDVLKLAALPEAEVRHLARQAPPGLSCSVTSLEVKSAFGVRGRVWISSSDAGALSGVRLEVDSPEAVNDASALVDELRLLDATPSVYLRHADDLHDTGNLNDVASFAKIFILDAVLQADLAGRLRLDDGHLLRADHICPLSAGLSHAHIGCTLTVAELCTLMILRSDNTAADVLLEVVGPEAVETALSRAAPRLCSRQHQIRSMRALIEASWGMSSDAEPLPSDGRPAASLSPVHHLGLGHFIPLSALAPAMDAITSCAWSPWPPAAQARRRRRSTKAEALPGSSRGCGSVVIRPTGTSLPLPSTTARRTERWKISSPGSAQSRSCGTSKAAPRSAKIPHSCTRRSGRDDHDRGSGNRPELDADRGWERRPRVREDNHRAGS